MDEQHRQRLMDMDAGAERVRYWERKEAAKSSCKHWRYSKDKADMWFWQAAQETIEKYDKPNDHDGPRHWEYGIGLMVRKLLEITQERRGDEAAARMARHIQSACRHYERNSPSTTSASQ